MVSNYSFLILLLLVVAHSFFKLNFNVLFAESSKDVFKAITHSLSGLKNRYGNCWLNSYQIFAKVILNKLILS